MVVQAPGIFLESLLGFFPLASSVCCWLEVVKVNPWLSTLRGLAVEVVPWFLSGTCRLALVGLQCLWIPWSCGVPGLPVGSPVSGRVCVLPQSTLVTLLSLLLVGLTFSLRAGAPTSGLRCGLRLALVRAAVQPSHGSVLLLCPGFFFSGPGWCGRLPPCSFSSVFLRDVVTLSGL